jgi:8-oxo-dGTP pyrophosphatase MutT (NUDIX family)
MGQRHQAHVFMPGKYVFPGGRTESHDARRMVTHEGDPVTVQKLQIGMRRWSSNSRARGLLTAAIRETFEETGLLVGHHAIGNDLDHSGLIYFARAVTPPGHGRRFDSRFFVCDARIVTNLDEPLALASPELLALKWVTLPQALNLNLPSITQDILLLLEPFLRAGTLPDPGCPVSFHHKLGKSWIVEFLSHGQT